MATIAKIPFWSTLRDCVLIPVRQWRVVFHLIWAWLLIALPLTAVWASYNWSTNGGSFGEWISCIMQWIMMSSVAVGWHRFILTNRMPTGPCYLTLDRQVWTYFAWGIGISLPFWIIMAVIAFSTDSSPELAEKSASPELVSWLNYIVSFVLIFLLSLIMFRFMLVFPAAAMERELGLRKSFQLTRGNSIRLAALATLVTIIGIWPGTLLGGEIADHTRSQYILLQVAMYPALIFIAFAGITLLSLMYRHFVPQARQQTPLETQGNLP